MIVFRGVVGLRYGSADLLTCLVKVLVQGSVGAFCFNFGVRQRFFGIVFRLFGGLMGLLLGTLVLRR